MKLIICLRCNNAFSPTDKLKKCDCGLTAGRIVDGITHYSDSGNNSALVVDIMDVSFTDLHIKDTTAIREKKKNSLSEDDRTFYIKVIEYLNQKAGTSYSVKFPSSNSTLILSRRDEHKCGVEDFYRVIDNKVTSWKGGPMEMYLRPMTLFNRTKFINYLGENGSARQINTGAKSFDQFADSAQAAKENLLRRSDQGR